MSSAEADNHRNSISPSASALKAHLDGVEDLEVNNTANSIYQGESMLVTEQDVGHSSSSPNLTECTEDYSEQANLSQDRQNHLGGPRLDLLPPG